MKTWKPGACVVAFVVSYFALAQVPGGSATWLFAKTALAASFTWGYVAVGGGAFGALVWVAIVTVIYTMATFAILGLYSLESWSSVWLSLWRGVGVVDLITPFTLSLLVVVVLHQRRHAL
jgi:hypothetical protein